MGVLVAAACCPHPPLLVPELAQGAGYELDGLRASCDLAVGTLLRTQPEAVVVVGSGEQAGTWPGDAAGSLAGHGVDVLAGGLGAPVLPLPLTVGAWLLDRAGWTGRRSYATVAGRVDAPPDLLAGAGQGTTGVLCMADGSAKRSTSSPGQLDHRAEGYDAALAGALGSGDARALADLDPDLAAELWVAGAPAWRALGRAVVAGTADPPKAVLLHESAPYGVGYLVATWTWPGAVWP